MSDLHHRSTPGDAFCERLLSDYPEAKAERDWRRGHPSAATAEYRQGDIAGWADRISADPGKHTPMARDLAATIGPMAHASAIRAEIEAAEPDDLYVARQRTEFEAHMHNHPDHPDLDYRYQRNRLTGLSAASYLPPARAEDPWAGQ